MSRGRRAHDVARRRFAVGLALCAHALVEQAGIVAQVFGHAPVLRFGIAARADADARVGQQPAFGADQRHHAARVLDLAFPDQLVELRPVHFGRELAAIAVEPALVLDGIERARDPVIVDQLLARVRGRPMPSAHRHNAWRRRASAGCACRTRPSTSVSFAGPVKQRFFGPTRDRVEGRPVGVLVDELDDVLECHRPSGAAAVPASGTACWRPDANRGREVCAPLPSARLRQQRKPAYRARAAGHSGPAGPMAGSSGRRCWRPQPGCWRGGSGQAAFRLFADGGHFDHDAGLGRLAVAGRNGGGIAARTRG